MTASDAIMDFVEQKLGAQWEVQFGRWEDRASKLLRYAVLKPTGGGPAELVRTPTFTLSLIGRDGGDLTAASEAADAIVQAMRTSAGRLVFLQASEPAFIPAADGRPIFDIAISAIAN